MRLVIFAPHFAEYSTRMAAALAPHAAVFLINEKTNLRSECEGLEFDGGIFERAQYSGKVAMGGASLRRFFERRRIYRAIETFRPDVIHVQEQGDEFTVAVADRFAAACPIVLTIHDPVPHSGNDTLVAQRFASGLARLRAGAAAYHVHGAYCEAVLRQRLVTSKPVVPTRHGVILVPSPAQAREAEDRLLFFGRMEAYKGLETLLDAIDLLPPGQVRFALAGRGPELERFRDRIAANPAIEVIDKFLPPVEAIREFQRARAVIVPYRDATQSGVISAAFANGKSVVASRVGGLADSVADGDNGLLVPPGDPRALAEAIRRVSDPALGETLAGGATTAAGTTFSWDHVAGALHELYADLTRAKPKG